MLAVGDLSFGVGIMLIRVHSSKLVVMQFEQVERTERDVLQGRIGLNPCSSL